MKLDILYEDNHIIVAYKPKGILSQADGSEALDMLTLLKEYIKVKYNKPGDVYLGLVHRLDRNTSGVMVFARTSKAASRLSEDIRNNKMHKEYLAILEGNMPISSQFITLKDYLLKNESENKSYVNKNGKEAILEYKVLASTNNESLVRIKLITGRHHQIRCQFANINHPLVGDNKYGAKKTNGLYCLQAYKLSFIHPTIKDERIFTKIDIDSSYSKFSCDYEKDFSGEI